MTSKEQLEKIERKERENKRVLRRAIIRLVCCSISFLCGISGLTITLISVLSS